MDAASVTSLDVSLHAAEDLRHSLNNSSRRLRDNSTDGDASSCILSYSTIETPSYSSSFSESVTSQASVDSVRTWPRKSSPKKSRNGATNRFLKSQNKGSKSCTLHSHSKGAEICPFDGSKYVLKPFTRSAYYFDSHVVNSNGHSSKELGFSIPSFDSNSNGYDYDENEHEIMKELKLNTDLWSRASSCENGTDVSSPGKMSSCRYDLDDNAFKSCSNPSGKFSPITPNAGIQQRLSSPKPKSRSCREGNNTPSSSTDNSISTFRKELEAKYNSYREEYLTNSPTEELQTLNGSIVNVRKWLRRRNDTLKNLLNTDSNKVLQDSSTIQGLISDAKLQQEGVDVLLDRGHRFLAQRANIVLEVDLENLVFLWNSYVEDLRKLYKSFCKETDVKEVKDVSKKAEQHSNLKSENRVFSCQSEISSLDTISPASDFQEYDSICSTEGSVCNSEVKISVEFLDDNSKGSLSDVSCADSGQLTLTDLTTSDSPLDISDLSTQEIKKFSSNSEASPVSVHSKQNGSDHFQYLQDYSSIVTVNKAQASSTVESESEKMEMEVAEELTADFDQRSNSSSLSLDNFMSKDRESSGSPKGSSEGLAAIFDKPGHQLMDCIHLGSPTEPKRRRRLLDTPSSVSSISSRSGSPISLKDSGSNTPTSTLSRGDRQNDLWNAIGNIDNFLLDKDILEACKSTEKDLSSTDDDCVGAPSVSFAEFLQQYKELIDWLNQMHKVVQREVTSLSEKYLNQAYHEEMLERSPRREFLNTYSVQVLLRYPNMSGQISARMNRLNAQWTAVEEAIAPKHGKHDEDSMLQDLECDLGNLRRWLHAIEARLLPLTIHSDWSDSELEERLLQHQALQRDIESHNKVINAVLKLSERLEKDAGACGSDKDRDSLQLVALNLERRWHTIWLQSLEWQCRLEEGIRRRKGNFQSGFDFSGFSLPVLDESLFNHCSQDINDRGLITLDDDSLLFIGGGRDFDLADSNGFDSEVDLNNSSNTAYDSSDTEKEFEYFPGGFEEVSDCEQFPKRGGEEALVVKSQSRPSNSKPDSPLGKRRYTDPTCYEGSPAKKGPSAILSSSGELSSGSPNTSLAVSTEDVLAWPSSISTLHHGKLSSPIPIDDLKILQVKRSLFDNRSSGDSANISEAESKMGDSPPSPFPDDSVAVTSSDLEADQPASPPCVVKVESKDIGYSSENQSNDEVETMRQQIAMEYKFRGKCELAKDGPLGDKVLFPSVRTRSSYYQMTHVTDVDSTDRTDNGDTTDSGPEKMKDSDGISACFENGKSSGGTDEFGEAVKDVYSHLESISNESETAQMECDINNRKLPKNKKVNTSNSFCQTESPLNNLVPIHQIVDFSESDSAPETKGKKSVRYLIEHAEDLVRPSTSPKKSRPLSPQKVSSSTQSLLIPSPSKQTQTDSYSTVESSCDASGEDNSDHEANRLLVKGEMSTGTDDAEDRTLYDSVVNLGSATESANNISLEEMKLSSFQNSPVMDTPRLRKQTGLNSRRRSKKDRPWSVVGFQDSTPNPKKSDSSGLQAVATSESAINNIHCHTDSDSCSTTNHPSSSSFMLSHSSTFPRAAGHHYDKRRAISLCAHTSYHNIVTATQDLSTSTVTTPAIQSSISSFPPQTFITTSDVSSSGADVPNTNSRSSSSKHQKQRRTRRMHSKSLSSNQDPDAIKLSASDSYDSADAESESETTDEYLTACMEVCSSEAEDAHNVSGSLSEHSTWDNYQMFYPTGSEDPGEELLTWEPQDDLEFDEDFQIPSERSIVKDALTSKAKTKLKIKKQGAIGEDSDSDLEDFHDILNQSELQLKLANQSLKKKRHDPMGTSLHPNPEKYSEILVTHDTNKKCLESICLLLNTEDVTEADVKRVQDLMEQWSRVYALASERHAQTTTLGEFRHVMTKMKNCIQETGGCLSYDRFSSADELKQTIAQLKQTQGKLKTQAIGLDTLKSQLSEFASQNPFLNVGKYEQELDSLSKANTDTFNKVSRHVEGLENNWSVWVEYLSSQQELDAWLAADRERLHGLLAQREFGSKVTKKDVLTELETLQSNLATYEEKLTTLQAMHSRLTHTSNDDAQRLLLASLADLRNQLFVVSERCKQAYKDAEDDAELAMDQCPDLSSLALQASALSELMSSPAERSFESKSRLSECPAPSLSSSPSPVAVHDQTISQLPASRVCVSWLRSVPVHVVALVFVAGLVYALDPDILDRLTNFSLSVTPELRYVNGPPAI